MSEKKTQVPQSVIDALTGSRELGEKLKAANLPSLGLSEAMKRSLKPPSAASTYARMALDRAESLERLDSFNRKVAQRRAEQDAAPLITRDAVVALRDEMGELVEVVKTLAEGQLETDKKTGTLVAMTDILIRLTIGVMLLAVLAVIVTVIVS